MSSVSPDLASTYYMMAHTSGMPRERLHQVAVLTWLLMKSRVSRGKRGLNSVAMSKVMGGLGVSKL